MGQKKKNSETFCVNVSVKIRYCDWIKPGLIKGVLWQQIMSTDQQEIANNAF